MLKTAHIANPISLDNRMNANRFNQFYKLAQLLVGAVIRILYNMNTRESLKRMLRAFKSTGRNNDLCRILVCPAINTIEREVKSEECEIKMKGCVGK